MFAVARSRYTAAVTRLAVCLFVLLGCGSNSSSGVDGGTPQDGPPGTDGGGPQDDGGRADAGPLLKDVTPFRSGTRLKAVYETAGSGAEQLVQWMDTSLNLPCTFALDIDRNLRCMPATTLTLQYQDANCSEAMTSDAIQDGELLVRSRIPGGSCININQVQAFSLGPTIELSESYELLDGSCVARAAGSSSYTLLTSVDHQMFQSGEVTDFAIDSELAVRMLDTDDGAQQVLSMVGRQAGQPCTPFGRDLSNDVCIPGDQAFELRSFYSDSGCTTPLANSRGGAACDPPTRVVQFRRDDVGDCRILRKSLFDIGAGVSGEDAFELNGTCEAGELPNPPGSDFHWWEVGSELGFDSVPAISRVGKGTGDVRAGYWASASGVTTMPVSAGTLWVDPQGVTCTLLQRSTGEKLCVPGASTTGSQQAFWADAACSATPLTQVRDDGCGTTDPALSRFIPPLHVATTVQQQVLEVNRVEADSEVLADVFQLSGGSCVGLANPADDKHRYYRIGAAVPIDDFSEIVRVQAP